ncbi:strictosidine synthase [Shinella sp. HZN7]|uniref:strictosidine synthase n=1 Tax=Shinella sp. (strain HZN7) TaxID=879274 RepID=UPI0011AB4108|nr:strictosidine synthase [Shinella sp. HZN7]
MMGFLSRIFGRSGEDGLSVPPMDGVFKPNSRLDDATRILDLPGIDNLALAAGALHCSSADRLLRIDLQAGRADNLRRFGRPITAVAGSPRGRLAVAVEGIGVEIGGEGNGWRLLRLEQRYADCITAALFVDEETVALAVGSQAHAMSAWKRDLMSHGASGAVIRHRIPTGTTDILCDGLAFPYGLALDAGGNLLVSESWRHRIVEPQSRAVQLDDLPAYPARLSPAGDGGYWLALFAPRRQLTEFVLRESDYRREMMATIPPEAWIGPDFSSGNDGSLPLQAGSVRQMGSMKPWAPSRSYGMVVRLDRTMAPLESYHSRADGRMHGIASVVEVDDVLYAASRGAGTLLRLDLAGEVPA